MSSESKDSCEQERPGEIGVGCDKGSRDVRTSSVAGSSIGTRTGLRIGGDEGATEVG